MSTARSSEPVAALPGAAAGSAVPSDDAPDHGGPLSRLRLSRHTSFDLCLALAVGAFGLIVCGIVLARVPKVIPPWLPMSLVAAILICLGLFLRRKRPLAAWLLVTFVPAAHYPLIRMGWADYPMNEAGPFLLQPFSLAAVPIILGTLAAREPLSLTWTAAPTTVLSLSLLEAWMESYVPDADKQIFPVFITALFPYTILSLVGITVGLTIRAQRTRLTQEIENARRLALEHEQASLLAVSAERSRIAREMHDIVAHSLAVMVTMADGASAALDHRPETARQALTALAETGRSALADTRRLVGVLREDPQVSTLTISSVSHSDGPLTDAQGRHIKDLPVPEFAPPGAVTSHQPTAAVADLRQTATAQTDSGSTDSAPMRPAPEQSDLQILVDRFAAAGVPITYNWRGRDLPEDRGLQMTVFRIAQEALTNVLRYAPTTARVSVDVERHIGTVILTVENDAAPGASPMHGSGKGLIGMKERAAVYGGSVQAGPHAGGWRVRTVLRWDEEDQEGSAPWEMPM